MKPISNFPDYAITKDGQVWSGRRGVWLKPVCGRRKGYLHLNLSRNRIVYTCNIHRLVLETYVGPCPEGLQCRHIDGDYFNNNLGNLCWGTKKENAIDMVKHGTSFFARQKGEKHPFAKLTEKKVKIIRKMLRIGIIPQVKIAQYYQVSPQAISHIKNQKNWKKV